jgi:hypothetical protein
VFDSIVDPTIGPAADAGREPVVLAKRPASLSGLRLGLLANTKRNAEQFLDQVGKLLAAQYGVRTVLAAKKPDITDTAPQQILDDLRAGCDIVVTGVGDCGSCSASAVADGLLLEQSGLRGAPGYRYVTTPHPVASLTPDGVRERARQAIPPIVALLTQPAMAASP